METVKFLGLWDRGKRWQVPGMSQASTKLSMYVGQQGCGSECRLLYTSECVFKLKGLLGCAHICQIIKLDGVTLSVSHEADVIFV
jgi:hypothetical protein